MMVGALVEFIEEVPISAAVPGERGIIVNESDLCYTVVTTFNIYGSYQKLFLSKEKEGQVFRVLHPGYTDDTAAQNRQAALDAANKNFLEHWR